MAINCQLVKALSGVLTAHGAQSAFGAGFVCACVMYIYFSFLSLSFVCLNQFVVQFNDLVVNKLVK